MMQLSLVGIWLVVAASVAQAVPCATTRAEPPLVETLTSAVLIPGTPLRANTAWIVSPDCRVDVIDGERTGSANPLAPVTRLRITSRKIGRVERVPSWARSLILDSCTLSTNLNFTNSTNLQILSIAGGTLAAIDEFTFSESSTNITIQSTDIDSIKNASWPSQLTSLTLVNNKITSPDSSFPESLIYLDLSGNPIETLEKMSFIDSLITLRLPKLSIVRGVKWPQSLSILDMGSSELTEFEIRESDLATISLLVTFNAVIKQTACSDLTARVAEVHGQSVCVISDGRFEAEYHGAITPSPPLPPMPTKNNESTPIPVGSTGSSTSLEGEVGDPEDPEVILTRAPASTISPRDRISTASPGPKNEEGAIDEEPTEGSKANKQSTPVAKSDGNDTSSSKKPTSTSPNTSTPSSDSSASQDKTVTSSVSSSKWLVLALVIGSVSVVLIASIGYRVLRKHTTTGDKSPTFASLETPTPSGSHASATQPDSSQDVPIYMANDVRNDEALASYRIPFDSVTMGVKIATGGFGVIHRGVFSGRDIAIKRMLPTALRDDAAVSRFMDEIRLCASLKHRKIVEFIGVSWTSLRDLSVITEYMAGGDLYTTLRTQPGPLPSSWSSPWTSSNLPGKATMAADIAEAVAYLHSLEKPVLHRDLKARNVMLGRDGLTKLSDFGISREVQENETMTSEIGTVAWIAPEVLRGERYSEKADMYSFGVLLVEMDRCRHPYEGVDDTGGSHENNAFKNANLILLVSSGQLRPTLSSECPPEIQGVVDECLQFNPELRPSASKVWRRLSEVS